MGRKGHIKMVILVSIFAYLLFSAFIVVCICALSARMSRDEAWAEVPLTEGKADGAKAREYPTEAPITY